MLVLTVVGHDPETEFNDEPVSRFLQKLSRQASFFHVVKVKEKVRPRLFLASLKIFHNEPVVLALNEKLEAARCLPLTSTCLFFILFLNGYWRHFLLFILSFRLLLRYEITTLNV
jgi:hypothetical protein